MRIFLFFFTETSLANILSRMKSKLSGPILKITVDESDIIADAFAIFKDNKFEAFRPVRVNFIGQPAVDSGGPRREFFTRLFQEIAYSTQGLAANLFEGEEGRLLPSYSTSTVCSGVMKVIGKMIAYSIVQCGVGFPFLSPVCYWYLVTDDVNQAISYANITDVRDIEYADLIRKVTLD